MTDDIIRLNILTMSSLEIAKLTGKQHKHVLRDIDLLLESLSPEMGLGFKTSTYKDDSGKSNRCFELDKDSTFCLLAGYDVTARMKIIKRWQELEAVLREPEPPTRPAISLNTEFVDTFVKTEKLLDNPRLHPTIKQFLLDDLQSNYLLDTGRSKTLLKNEGSQDLYLGVVEIYKRLRGYTLRDGLDISAGRRVAKHLKPTKVERIVNGEMRKINAYHKKDWEDVASLVDDLLEEKGILDNDD